MIKKWLPVFTLLLISMTAKNSQAQTLFMGDDFIGIGLQSGFISIDDIKPWSLSIGTSINRKADLGLTIATTSNDEDDNRNAKEITSFLFHSTFFPSREWNGDDITTEFLTGIGKTSVTESTVFTVGVGVSKATLKNKNDESNLRPRLSVAYTIYNQGNESSDYKTSAPEMTASLEMIIHLQSDTVSFLMIPAISYYPNIQSTGPGFSASLIF